jgi:hypothetical protein
LSDLVISLVVPGANGMNQKIDPNHAGAKQGLEAVRKERGY